MANDTPESDFSIECFQNYSAPEVFVQGLAGMVDQTDVEVIIRAQKNIPIDHHQVRRHLRRLNRNISEHYKVFRLQRFEKTTEMLTNCNQLSASRLRAASEEFKKHTLLLLEMKKDLNFIFKKIRAIKTKLSTQYPDAYKEAVAMATANRKPIDEDEEEEDFRHSDPKPESKMVTTVSTETLKPTTSDGKKSKKNDRLSKSADTEAVAAATKSQDEIKVKKNSSSSETESASSGDESSTDTG